MDITLFICYLTGELWLYYWILKLDMWMWHTDSNWKGCGVYRFCLVNHNLTVIGKCGHHSLYNRTWSENVSLAKLQLCSCACFQLNAYFSLKNETFSCCRKLCNLVLARKVLSKAVFDSSYLSITQVTEVEYSGWSVKEQFELRKIRQWILLQKIL